MKVPRRFVFFAVLALCVLARVSTAAALVPVPSQDPFYAVPAGITGLSNGTILKSRAVQVYADGTPLQVSAWQLKYKSLDAHNRPTAMVTTVMVPNTPWRGSGPRPLVSYQVAEDGADSKCAASYALHAGAQAASTQSNAAPETSLISQTLQRGWAVVASDYEGPDSHFFAALEEAHGTLDGIRAALHFSVDGFGKRTPVGLIGYSGGGYATAVAALSQPSYAPELKLAGAAIGSPTTDVRAEIRAFSGSVAGGAITMGIAALNRAYPEQHLLQYLNSAGRQAVAQSGHDCLVEAAERHPFARVEQFEATPGSLDLPPVTRFLASISPLHMPGHPTLPVLLYQDAADELAPAPPALQTVQKWCARGSTVQVHLQPGGEHIAYQSEGLPVGLDYLADRFARKAAPSTCPPLRLRALRILQRRHLHVDRRGRVTLRVRNPNPVALTLTTITIRASRSGRLLLQRTRRIALTAGHAKSIRWRLARLAPRGHGRLKVKIVLATRAPRGQRLVTHAPATLVRPSR